MPVCVMLNTVTDEGRKTVMERPESISEANREVQSMGAKTVEQYAVLTSYDFINIAEAPDSDTTGRIPVGTSSHGTAQFMTLPAISAE